MKEIQQRGDIILCSSTSSNLVGAGAAEARSTPRRSSSALARGEIQTIGATTLDEYRKYLERDAASSAASSRCASRSRRSTRRSLRGLRDRYEAHHRCKISDEALQSAAVSPTATSRTGTFRTRPSTSSTRPARASVSRRCPRRRAAGSEEEIDKVRADKESAIESQEFEKAAQLRDKERKLTQKKKGAEEEWRNQADEEQPEIGEDEIADIVSMWTGIPVFKLTEAESARLVRMEDELHKRVIGQHQAIVAVAKAIRRARAGIKDPKRPTGSFIFLGPSGVGKTELARTLAEFLFGDEDALIQVDMSEYMEKHSVSRLVGSPPGYVGYDEGGRSRRPCAGSRTRSSSSTRSRRRTRTSSTSCCRSSRTGSSRTRRAARSTSATPS